MSPVEEAPVAEPVIPVPESALPESAAAALPKVSADFDVDKFFDKKEEPKVAEPAPKPKAEVVSADDAPPATLAAKLAAKAKPAVEAPAVEAPAHPEETMELDGRASAATRENFKTLKGVTKELRTTLQTKDQEIADYKAKLEAASKAPSATETAELVKLREEQKALSDRLLLIDTQNHPKFKAQFVEPKNQAIAAAKELLGDKAAGVAKLMDLPRAELGKALSELTKDLPDLDRRDVTDSLYKAWQLEQGGREALSRANETSTAIRTKTVEEQKALFGTRFEKIVPTLAEHLVKLEAPANSTAAQRAEIDAYNKGAEGIRAAAEKVALGQIDEDAIVSHAAKSAAYDFHIAQVMPRLGREFAEMQDVIAGLKKELAMYHGKNPKRDISAPSSEARAAAKPQTIEELADAHFAKA